MKLLIRDVQPQLLSVSRSCQVHLALQRIILAVTQPSDESCKTFHSQMTVNFSDETFMSHSSSEFLLDFSFSAVASKQSFRYEKMMSLNHAMM
jgi:hypothetical protein